MRRGCARERPCGATDENVAVRRQAAVRQIWMVGICQMGMSIPCGACAIALLVVTLTNGGSGQLIVGAPIAIGAAVMTFSAGVLGFLSKSNYSSMDTGPVVGSKLRRLIFAHYMLCLILTTPIIMSLVWIGKEVGGLKHGTEYAMAIATIVLIVTIGLLNFNGATLFCRNRITLGLVRQDHHLHLQVCKLEKRLEQYENQQQQPGTHAPPSYNDSIFQVQGENYKTQYSSSAYGAPM